MSILDLTSFFSYILNRIYMKKLNITIILSVSFLFLLIGNIKAQNFDSLISWNGNYHLMDQERSVQPGKTGTTEKLIQIEKNSHTILLATSECDQCTPSVFTYQKDESMKYEKPIFFNSMGLYMIALDKNSFGYFMATKKLGDGVWEQILFANYYSKDKSKVSKMTQKSLKEIAKNISIKLN